MPRKGRLLERVVAALENLTADQEHVSVESPKRLRNKLTGRSREFDVVLTFKHQHHEVYVAIECRDRTSKVGEPGIEAFSKKCELVGVGSMVIVSPTGFTKSGKELGERLGVKCFTLDEVEEFDWFKLGPISFYQPKYDSMKITIVLPKEHPYLGEKVIIKDASGKETDLEGLYSKIFEGAVKIEARRLWQKNPTIGTTTHKFFVKANNFMGYLEHRDLTVPIAYFEVTFELTVSKQHKEPKFKQYSDQQGNVLSEAVLYEIDTELGKHGFMVAKAGDKVEAKILKDENRPKPKKPKR